eukprot:gene38960-48112_t
MRCRVVQVLAVAALAAAPGAVCAFGQAPRQEPTAAPVAAASVSQPAPAQAGLPAVTAYKLPIESLQQVAQDSGLVWVNSDADKIASVQAAIAAEPQPVRVPRERPPAVVLNEGPLVLVETRKDLKDLNVPF